MKIVITRKLPYDVNNAFDGHRVEYNSNDEVLSPIRLRQMITDADAIITTPADIIDRVTLESAQRLQIIVNYAVGYDNIDIEYAKQRGILVCTTQNVLTQSTAELGFSLLLATSRRIVEGDKLIRTGKFTGTTPNMLLGAELHKKTIGFYGMGNIGQAMAKIATGFSMDIIYHNRNRNYQAELLLGATYATFDELLEWSDFLVITAPLTEETKHKFTLNEFRKMKKNSILVNIGRGAIIKESDLASALKEELIFGAGLDVYENEPIVNDLLKNMDNVILLPHIGSATYKARSDMAKMCIDTVLEYLEQNIIPKNCINR